MNVWIEGARPKTLIASLSPVLIGSVVAYTQGAFRLPIFVCTLLFALFIQIGTNFANDYYDFIKGADTEKRQGPRRLTQSGLVTPETMKKGAALIFGLSALCAIYLAWEGGLIIALLAALAILFGYLYTAGPFPLGYKGLGDLFVLVFFGPVATCGTTYLQTNVISSSALIAGLSPGLISTAILVSNNLRDLEEDRLVGKRTLPVRFGHLFGRFEYAFCLILALLIPLYFIQSHRFLILTLVALFVALPLTYQIFKEDYFHAFLPKTGKLLILFTILFIIGWLL